MNVYEAKIQLSKLLQQVEAGDEIVIARNGRRVARLVPIQRATGFAEGQDLDVAGLR
ncbi:MAG: type II toxin-antitoxin system Phd/YefM family antitoxin [Pseudonocardiaceae bacterium]